MFDLTRKWLGALLDWVTRSVLRIFVFLLVVAATSSSIVALLIEALVNYQYPLGD